MGLPRPHRCAQLRGSKALAFLIRRMLEDIALLIKFAEPTAVVRVVLTDCLGGVALRSSSAGAVPGLPHLRPPR